jgi:hypothetical protein
MIGADNPAVAYAVFLRFGPASGNVLAGQMDDGIEAGYS